MNRKFLTRRVVSIFLISFFFIVKAESSVISLNPIWRVGKNWIFIGESPVVDDVFLYGELVNEIKLHSNGKLNEVYIVDINLLMSSLKETAVERNFFRTNPDLGEFLQLSVFKKPEYSDNITFFGPQVSNVIVEQGTMSYAYNSYDNYIPGTVQKIHDIANYQGDKPLVLYIHAVSGYSRAFEVVGSYLLEKQRISFSEALKLGEDLFQKNGNHLHYFSKLALEWQCRRLMDEQEKKDICIF